MLARVNGNLFTINLIDRVEQVRHLVSMESVKASYFKNHFGAIMDRAGERAVRIERRGREPAVLISESAYRAMRQRRLQSESQQSAMARLRQLATGGSVDINDLSSDARAAAILEKHSKHTKA